MTVVLWILVATVLLQFILILVQQIYAVFTVGIKYGLSNREKPKPNLALGGRIDRAILNLQENLLMFVPVVVVLASAGINNSITQTGAIVFFIARIVHAISYILGILVVRSLAWFAGIIGISMMLSALF